MSVRGAYFAFLASLTQVSVPAGEIVRRETPSDDAICPPMCTMPVRPVSTYIYTVLLGYFWYEENMIFFLLNFDLLDRPSSPNSAAVIHLETAHTICQGFLLPAMKGNTCTYAGRICETRVLRYYTQRTHSRAFLSPADCFRFPQVGRSVGRATWENFH